MCGFGFPFNSKAIGMTSVLVGGVSAQGGEFLQIAEIHLLTRSGPLFQTGFHLFLSRNKEI